MRFNIPLSGSKNKNEFEFYTIKNALLIAKGYERIVVGERGPYLEFTDVQILKKNIYIPAGKEYRLHDPDEIYYYVELRTNVDFIKIYFQKKVVSYADYKIGMYYISPYDLKYKLKEEVYLKPIIKTPPVLIFSHEAFSFRVLF